MNWRINNKMETRKIILGFLSIGLFQFPILGLFYNWEINNLNFWISLGVLIIFLIIMIIYSNLTNNNK